MVARDPYAVNMLAANIHSALVSVVERRGLPKDEEAIKWMSLLITLGDSAHKMQIDQHFKVPDFDQVQKE